MKIKKSVFKTNGSLLESKSWQGNQFILLKKNSILQLSKFDSKSEVKKLGEDFADKNVATLIPDNKMLKKLSQVDLDNTAIYDSKFGLETITLCSVTIQFEYYKMLLEMQEKHFTKVKTDLSVKRAPVYIYNDTELIGILAQVRV